MAQEPEFVAYVIGQLERAATDLGLPCHVRRHFDAASFSLGKKRVALIVNNTLFMHLEPGVAARWLPDALPLQPAGVNIESQFYPVPLAWLVDLGQLGQCLAATVAPQVQQATA